MKRPATRQLALFAALGLSLAATAWVSGRDEPEPVAAAPRRARAATATTDAAATAPAGWPAAASARAAWPPLDPQARSAWGETAPAAAAPPPPQPVAAALPPPAPTAPPFPYQLVGRLTDDSHPRAILNGALRSAVVGVGELVDGQWRVDAIEPGGLRLTYLPLGLAQFVPFASSSSPAA